MSEGMRRLVPSIASFALAAALAAGPAWGQTTGGAATPSGGGGTQAGQAAPEAAAEEPPSKRRKARRRPARPPVLAAFGVSRTKLFYMGRSARVRFRIDSRERRIRVKLVLRRPGSRTPVSSIALGPRRTRRHQSVPLTGRENGALPQGTYVLGISARDGRGRRLRRGPSVRATREVRFIHHRFPLTGPFSYGGPGARFGAGRVGRRHQGQDLVAASGTPIVAPRAGTVKTVAYQAGGAGHYVVLRGSRENRDYVFMHMLTGSVRVRVGQTVRTGQRIGEVGSTGGSSGPHLHFEVWVGGWFSGGHPVDPLPLLRAWDAAD